MAEQVLCLNAALARALIATELVAQAADSSHTDHAVLRKEDTAVLTHTVQETWTQPGARTIK